MSVKLWVHACRHIDIHCVYIVQYLEEEHRVLHYWYTAWPDHKAPNTAKQLLSLVKEVEQHRYQPHTHKPSGPVVVHCR